MVALPPCANAVTATQQTRAARLLTRAIEFDMRTFLLCTRSARVCPWSDVSVETEHPDQVSAEDRLLLGVIQKRRVDDQVHRVGPAERHVGAVHDLRDPHLGNEMP